MARMAVDAATAQRVVRQLDDVRPAQRRRGAARAAADAARAPRSAADAVAMASMRPGRGSGAAMQAAQGARMPAARVAQEAPAPPAPPALAPAADFDYDAFELGGFAGGIGGNLAAEYAAPYISRYMSRWVDPEKVPFFGTDYGKVVAGRIVSTPIGVAAGMAGQGVANVVRHLMHDIRPTLVSAPKPGLGISSPSLPALATGMIKGIATGSAKVWLKNTFTPPPPPPPPPPAPAPGPGPAPAPGPKPAPGPAAAPAPAGAADAATGPAILGKPLKELGQDAAMGALGVGISTLYDHTLGMLVQRTVNTLTGNSEKNAELKPPPPPTPGGVASSLLGGALTSVLMRPVELPSGGAAGVEGAAAGAGLAGALGVSFVNALLGAAFDSVYSRGLGPAIADTVNQAAGYPAAERTPQVGGVERFLRTLLRSGASGTAYYLVDGLSRGAFATLGASIGGGWGALAAAVGPTLLGMTSATALDQLLGPTLGRLGGAIYSFLTGKPAAEQRAADAAAGDGTGDAAKPPNGNPGTVPSKGAPAAGPADARAGASEGRADERQRRRAAAMARAAMRGAA